MRQRSAETIIPQGGAMVAHASGYDRRSGHDRRCALDRRGASGSLMLYTEQRPYRFRNFAERRSSQDRRLYIFTADSRGQGHAARGGWSEDTGREVFVRLSREEISMLLSSIDDDRDGRDLR